MDKLFEVADRYVKTSDWKTISVLKFCLISLGVMLGMLVKPKDKKKVYGIGIGFAQKSCEIVSLGNQVKDSVNK